MLENTKSLWADTDFILNLLIVLQVVTAIIYCGLDLTAF